MKSRAPMARRTGRPQTVPEAIDSAPGRLADVLAQFLSPQESAAAVRRLGTLGVDQARPAQRLRHRAPATARPAAGGPGAAR